MKRSLTLLCASVLLLMHCSKTTCDETRSCDEPARATEGGLGAGGASEGGPGVGGAAGSSSGGATLADGSAGAAQTEAGAGGDAGTGGNSEAGEVCLAPRVKCGVDCANTSNDSTHCGACGQDCGGGLCAGAMCQPGVVYSAASGRVYQMQVDAQGVYFTEPDGTDVVGIDTCPLSGCTGKPRRIRANVDTDFAVAAGYVVMAVTVAAPTLSVQLCPTSGCAATPPVLTSGTRRYAFASSASDFYWLVLFGAQTLTRCVSPTAAGCTSTISPGSTAALPMAMTDTDIFVKQLSAPNDLAHLSPTVSGTPADLGISGAIITAIAAYGSDAYVLTVAPPPRILRCAGAGCPTPTLLANPSASSTEIAVDDTGIYWLAGDTIQTCPLAGCPPAGSTEIASGLSLPNHLRLQGHFVYWIEVMTYVDGGSGWMLRRVAKPL